MFGYLLGGAAIAAPGQLDPKFGANGIVIDTLASSSTGLAAELQMDGKLIVVGACATGNAVNFCAARYLPSGLPDIDFGANGHVITAVGDSFAQAFAVAVQTDGRIVVAGLCSNGGFGFCLIRYDSTGSLDSSFGMGGIVLPTPDGTSNWVKSVRVQDDGRIVAAGQCASPQQSTPIVAELCVVRYLANGVLDTSFGQSGRAVLNRGQPSDANAIIVQTDGKIVAAGRCSGVGLNNFCVARFDVNGVPDTFFGTGGVTVTAMTSQAFEAALAVALTRTGRIIAGGYCLVKNQLAFCLARYLMNGQLDPDFGSMGKVFTPIGVAGGARALSMQGDGKVLAVGDCSPTAQTFDYCAARYTAEGVLDASFAGGPITVPIGAGEDRGRAVVIQPDGKFVVVGYCVTGGANRFCLARFEGGPYPTADCGLDVDRNLVADSQTDALLTLRYLLGYRGSSLIVNVVGQNAGRSGAEIESYLAVQLLSDHLDADGDGQTLAMTDGLLLLRAMLGLTGDALTQGATNAAHPNVRNAQQILTWIESTHGVACLP